MQWVVVAVYAVLRRRARLPAAAGGRCALVQQPHGLRAMGVLGRCGGRSSSCRCSSSGARGAALFCPEGTLTEAASRVGLGRAVPRWLKWGGLAVRRVRADDGLRPAGQRLSVSGRRRCWCSAARRSPRSASASSTAASKRVWCRHLCPVNGVFAVLSRVAPVHFRVDRARGRRTPAHIADSSGQLRAAGAHPAHDRPVGMPHVRTLQRPARRDRARARARRTAKWRRWPPTPRRDGMRC